MEVIQRSIDTLGANRYLEVGVSDGKCFCSLSVPKKIGVDPIPPGPAVISETQKPGVKYFALTSDEFFKTVAPQVLADGVDVIFIDGLHTFEQAYRDCMNALEYLSPGGVILLHDCLPSSEAEAVPALSYDEAWKINGPTWNGYWVGDVWKAILLLRSQHCDLQVYVLHCDQGIGLVYTARNDPGLSLSREQISKMAYIDLARDRNRLLGLRKPAHLLAVLNSLTKRRTKEKSIKSHRVH